MRRATDKERSRAVATLTWLHVLLLVAAFSLLLYSILMYSESNELQALSLRKYSDGKSEEALIFAAQKMLVGNVVSGFSAHTPRSKYAYATLLSGFTPEFKYRGFVYNALIMRKALRETGSTADFIVMAAFPDTDTALYEGDMELLRASGIVVHYLPRIVANKSMPLRFAEMALLKVTPWSFTEYQRIQFLDGDVMPTRNMDCFFQLNDNAFTIGAVSPLNSGWFVAVPNKDDYDYMLSKAKWRLGGLWDEDSGWAEAMPRSLFTRGGLKEVRRWDFNGADMDQGLLTHTFVLTRGRALLIDTQTRAVKHFKQGLLSHSPSLLASPGPLSCCRGDAPTELFVHFTGKQKPWMTDLTHIPPRNANLRKWAAHLDSLRLDINSSTIGSLGLSSPLGFWNAQIKIVKKGPKQ